jgi:selenide,water dikinase
VILQIDEKPLAPRRALLTAAPRRIAVVGGGAAGVEMLLAMQSRLRTLSPSAAIGFDLVGDTASLLPTHNEKVGAIFLRVLSRRGVTLRLGCAVERVDAGMLRLRGGGSVAADAIVWATGASAPSSSPYTGRAATGHMPSGR